MADPQTVTNIISFVLVLITGVYVYLTWKIAKANKQALQQMSDQFHETVRPFVIPSLRIYHSVFIALEIKNLGKSPAKNMRLSIDRDFFQFAEDDPVKNIRHFQAFQQMIQTFAPGEVLRFDLAQGFNIDIQSNGRNITPKNFCVNTTYESGGLTYRDTFHIDIGPYMHTHTPRTTPEFLESIDKRLEKIASKI